MFNLVLWIYTVGMAQTSSGLDSLKNNVVTARNDSLRIEAYNDFFSYWIHKDLDSSRYYTAKGYELARKSGISKGISDLSVYTAYVDMRRRKFGQAHRILDEAYRLLKEKDDYKGGEFHVLNWKAYIYAEEGKTDSARHTLKEIIEVSAKEFPQNTISAYQTLGDMAHGERNYYEAISYYQKADSLCSLYQKELPVCRSVLANIGVIFKNELLQPDKALTYLTRARQSYSDNEELIMVYEVDVEIAEIYFIQKSYDKAEALLNKSLNFFREQDIVKQQVLALNVLNRIYLETGEYDKASKYLDNMHALSMELKDTFHIAGALIHKGILGTKLQRYREAEEQLGAGLELAESIADSHLQGIAYNGLTKLYGATGKYDKALRTQEGYYQLQLDKEKAINQSKLTELEARYQAEKKEQEIELLASENSLVEQQKKTQKIIFIATSGILFLGVLSVFMLYRNREKTAKKLKELDRIKTRFFSNLSHEFRTPLALISGPVEHQLSKKEMPADDELDLRLIQRNANRMMELIDQLLELSSLDNGGRKLSVGYHNLPLFIRQLLEPFQYQANNQGINFQYDITVETMAWFDREVLHKILSNLLSNAVKYTDKNGYIRIEAAQKNGNAVFTITNSSIQTQLNNEEIEHIFTRFYQSDTNKVGVGIGLSLVKELVSLSRGDITVANKDGEVCFRVTIPVTKEAVPEDEITEGHSPEISLSSSGTLQEDGEVVNAAGELINNKPVLLIVDDNADICLFVENIFSEDYQVLKAENGLTGVRKAVETIPDIIISDIMMPQKDGIYLVNTLKNDERTSHIPVILLTAKSGSHNEISGLKTGADAYMVKPFQQEKLRVIVENMLKNRHLVQQHFKETDWFGSLQGEISSKDDLFLERLRNVLADNLTEVSFNVVRFSEAMCMSRMQLHRKLKALTGQSATEFIRDQRLRLAIRLLKKSGAGISEIAYRVGFNQPAYFTTCFKEVYKVSPSEYAEQYHGDD